MKRKRITTTSTAPGSRRTRSVAACDACRKLKTRCELLELDKQSIRCHRCKTLGLQCSYQDMDRAFFEAQKTSRSNSGEQDAHRTVEEHRVQREGPGVERKPEVVVHVEWLPRHMWKWFRTGSGEWQFFGQGNEDYDEENGGLNWSTPLAAIQSLTDSCYSGSFRPSNPSLSQSCRKLESILSKDQILLLLKLFDEKHSPWLNFDLIRSDSSPILDLVCCAVAARHLDEELRDAVSASLRLTTDDSVSKIIFLPRSSGSLEAIQVLLIIAFWDPLSGSTDETRDSHLLLASAISMALNLRLNEYPDRLLDARRSGNLNDHDMEDLTNKAKLWLTLTNADSLLSIGRKKTSLCTRGDTYNKLFPVPAGIPIGKSARQELRLRLLGNILDTCETGLNHQFASFGPEGFDRWYKRACDILSSFIPAERISEPLGVLSDVDKSPFHAITIISRTCHTLLIYHWRARRPSATSGPHSHPPNHSNATHWGKEALITCERTLLSIIEMDHRLLAPMPDFVFNYIIFLATYVIMIKFIVWNAMRRECQGLGDQLLSKAVDVLRRAGSLPDHPASKCAEVIHGMLNLWLYKERVLAHALANAPSTSDVADAVRTSTAPGLPETSQPATTTSTTTPSPPFEPPAEPYLFPSSTQQPQQSGLDFDWFNQSLTREFTSWDGFMQGSYTGYQ